MTRQVKLVSTTFRLTPSAFSTFKQKIPRHGDRSRFLARVVDMFNSGELSFDVRVTVNNRPTPESLGLSGGDQK